MKLTGIGFAPDAKQALNAHRWPGNVRELDNALQRALVLHQGNVIHASDLCLELGINGRMDSETPPAVPRAEEPSPELQSSTGQSDTPGNTSLGDEVRQGEFRIIIEALRKERGRRNRAAERLGISPRTLRYKLAQMRDAGIDLNAELAAA
jgi:two-component system response regulator FlrC